VLCANVGVWIASGLALLLEASVVVALAQWCAIAGLLALGEAVNG
jgi:hypothetical protein